MTAVPPAQPPSDALATPMPGLQSDAVSVQTLQKLIARLQRDHSKVQTLLSSLSFSLRSFNNLNQFLALIPLIVSRVTDSDAAALVLFRPNGKVSLEQLYCHEGSHCLNIRQALESVTHNTSNPGQVTPKYSVQVDQQLQQLLGDDYHWHSTAILVRNVEPHERGRLYLFSQNPDHVWNETRQKLAQLVADQTAVAIENDVLSAKVRKQERLARELEIGAEIQARLFPPHCPQIEGIEVAASCKTASQVGGDYYDFIPIYKDPASSYGQKNVPPDRWSVVIGDVMGKGVPAGLIMTMTRGMLRTDILNHHSPARILQDLNTVMYADLETSNRFVTLFYSEYEPKSQTLFFSNAAHHPPLLWRSHTDRIERLDTDGMLIGLDMNTTYREDRVQLYPGDTIIYYTDGFTDAPNPRGERFDEENLIRAFYNACHSCRTPEAISERLFNEVDAFIGRQGVQNDDMTLVVMRVQPKPVELPFLG